MNAKGLGSVICLAILAFSGELRANEPGVFADVTPLVKNAAAVRLALPRPDIVLAPTESLDSSLPPAFSARVTGFVRIVEEATYRIVASQGTLTVDGNAFTRPRTLTVGDHPFVLEWKRLPNAQPSVLSVSWSSNLFDEEPVPASAWVRAPSASGSDMQEGRRLANALGCQNCHTQGGTEAAMLGPKLTRIGSRVTPAWLFAWLANPQNFRKTAVMPTMNLTSDERSDVVAYLASLTNTSAPPVQTQAKVKPTVDAHGEDLWKSIGCLACHGSEGDTLAGLGSKYLPGALSAFLQNPLKSNPSGRMPSFLLDEDDANAIANNLMLSRNKAFESPAPQNANAAHGKALVQERGCLRCHVIDGTAAVPDASSAPAWNTLKSGRGCLAPVPPPKSPRYALSDRQRVALTAYLGTPNNAPAPRATFEALVDRFGCRRCHELEKPATIKFEETPPSLNDVAHKLKPAWLSKVLLERKRLRPWMNLRMPHYGEAATPLVNLFSAVMGATDNAKSAAPRASDEQIKEGVRILGRGEEGLACINCHDFGAYFSMGATRGPDMVSMFERLQPDWFKRWLKAPARISPGTQMPAFFAEMPAENADRRIANIWGALSLGSALPPPEGLNMGETLILPVAAAPVIVRTPWRGGSPRSIVVGFPQKISYVFDPDACRLTGVWAGGFLDVKALWSGRGGDPAKPLGVVRDVDGNAGLSLSPKGDRKAAQYLGYTLDKVGQPTFEYELGGVRIKEIVVPNPAGQGLRRTFTIPAGAPPLWLVVPPNDVIVTSVNGKASAGAFALQASPTKDSTWSFDLTLRGRP